MSDETSLNTDREIWRGKSRVEFGDDDRFYADSLFIPQSEVEALGINCGGSVIVKPIREWHRLAAQPSQPSEVAMDNEISITIRGREQVAIVMKALYDAGFVKAAAIQADKKERKS